MIRYRPINTLNTPDPVAIRAIREAFEDVVRKLQHDGERARPVSEELQAKIAREIVELCRQGERDAARLRDGALDALDLTPKA